jgi:hypothetical protein
MERYKDAETVNARLEMVDVYTGLVSEPKRCPKVASYLTDQA